MQQHIAGIFLPHLFHNSWNDYYLIVHLDHVECINDVKHIAFHTLYVTSALCIM